MEKYIGLALCIIIVLLIKYQYELKNRPAFWSGGVFLVMGDDSLVPVKWNQFEMHIPADSVIKGVFLAGAHRNMMPSVSFRLGRPNDETFTKTDSLYCYLLEESDNGVFQYYCEPICGKDFDMAILDVNSAMSWKGYRSTHNDGSYYSHILINLQDK